MMWWARGMCVLLVFLHFVAGAAAQVSSQRQLLQGKLSNCLHGCCTMVTAFHTTSPDGCCCLCRRASGLPATAVVATA